MTYVSTSLVTTKQCFSVLVQEKYTYFGTEVKLSENVLHMSNKIVQLPRHLTIDHNLWIFLILT